MKTTPLSLLRLCLFVRLRRLLPVLVLLPGSAAFSQTNYVAHFTGSFGDNIWQRNEVIGTPEIPGFAGNWSTGAYPKNGNRIINPNNGAFVPGPNPVYDVIIEVLSPTLGFVNGGVTVESVTLGSGANLHLAGGGSLNTNGLSIDATSALMLDDGSTARVNTAVVNLRPIRLNSTGGGATFVFGNNLALNSPGGIIMSNHGSNYIQSVNDGDVLNVSSVATISGAGFINPGFESTGVGRIVNAGIIEGTEPASLTIRMAEDRNARLVNQNLLRARNGGTLQFGSVTPAGAVVDNTGGTIAALDGSTVYVHRDTTVDGGTLTTSGTGTIHAAPTQYFTDAIGMLKDVRNEGAVVVSDGERLRLAGTFTNHGTLRMEGISGGSGTTLVVTNGTTLTGPGVLTLSNSSGNLITSIGNGEIFTIAPNAVIRGAGWLNYGFEGYGYVRFLNQGLIEGTQPTALSIRLTDLYGGPMINTGIVRASGGGTVYFQRVPVNGPATVQNTGGVIEALDNSTVTVFTGTTIEGGTVTTAGSGTIRGDGNTGGTLSNVTSTGTISIRDGERLGIAGTFTNNGTVDLNSAGNGAYLYLSGNVTLAAGTVTLGSHYTNSIAGRESPGQTFTIAPGATIQGGGWVSSLLPTPGHMPIAIANHGVIDSTDVMRVWVRNSDNSNVTNNGGVLRSSVSGAHLQFTSSFGDTGTVNNSGGTIEALNGGTVNVYSGASLTNNTGGTLTGGRYRAVGTNSLVLCPAPAVTTLAAGTEVEVCGTGAAVKFDDVDILSSLTSNAGILRVCGGRNFTVPAGFTNTGTLEARDPGSSLTLTGDYVNNGTIRVARGATLNTAGATSFINHGVLDIMTGGALPANFTNGPGGVVIDASAIKLAGVTRSAAELTLNLAGYTGHTYQLQRSDALSGFTAAGSPQPGVTGGTLTFNWNDLTPRRSFFRIAIDP